MTEKINTAIQKGLSFLKDNQEPDGSFLCLVSKKIDDYSRASVVPAIVPTNIVLSSLIHINSPLAETVKNKSAEFLLKEKSEYWSFNYWFRESDWYKKEPYPDDLDDTFCALAALYEYRPGIFNGDIMAKIVTMLTSAEKDEGGPYDMWLVPAHGRETWNDTDLVVNSNIAYFLSLQEISLPKLNAFIEKSIEADDYEFPYNKIYPGIYFISRFYSGKYRDRMIKMLLSKQEPDGKWENPLRTALSVSSIINLQSKPGLYDKQIEKAVNYLYKTQGKQGGWKPYSFYFQMRLPEKTLYAGSDSITTALCLEAMNKWQKLNQTDSAALKTDKFISARQIKNQILRTVKNRFAQCGEDLRSHALPFITRMLKTDEDQKIMLLPEIFRSALGKRAKEVPDQLIIKLGAANMFGWIAYTIYDGFFDGEGEKAKLSVANTALRESARLFRSAVPDSGFEDFTDRIFDIIDSANSWELKHARFDTKKGLKSADLPQYGRYGQLADKSLGHALGPAAILFYLGHSEESQELKELMSFFRNYIIARQLNDDAHDWEEDLNAGRINAAAVQVFNKRTALQPGELRELFWHNAIPKITDEIFGFTKSSRINLKRLGILKNRSRLEKMLDAIDNAAEKAVTERRQTLKFIKAYSRK